MSSLTKGDIVTVNEDTSDQDNRPIKKGKMGKVKQVMTGSANIVMVDFGSGQTSYLVPGFLDRLNFGIRA